MSVLSLVALGYRAVERHEVETVAGEMSRQVGEPSAAEPHRAVGENSGSSAGENDIFAAPAAAASPIAEGSAPTRVVGPSAQTASSVAPQPGSSVAQVESSSAQVERNPPTALPSVAGPSVVGDRSVTSTTSVSDGNDVQNATTLVTSAAPASSAAANPTTAAPQPQTAVPAATTSQPPATSAAPTTTTAAPRRTAQPSREVLLDAPIEGLRSFGFGQNQSIAQGVLEQQFGSLRYASGANWDDVSIVSDPGGDYFRVRSNVGNDSRKQWNAPIDPSQETYLVYQLYLEPGFDAGDGNGDEGSPTWGTGIKLPGLMRGNPADNTGGNHTAGGFSGRLMIRGTNSDGRTGGPRDGLSLAAYVYGQEIDNHNIASGFGEDYYFLNGFGEEPFEGINGGINEGVGDPRIWELEEGRWITLVLGYRVDGDNGWFKAWTMTEGGSLQPRLHIPNLNWTGGNRTDGPDTLLFQNFWGGSGSVWYPDSTSYMRFRNFAVFTNEADALAAAR